MPQPKFCYKDLHQVQTSTSIPKAGSFAELAHSEF